VSTGIKEDESSTGRVWAAGFHHITACSRLARILNLRNRLFPQFSNFFSDRGKPRILNQWIRGNECTAQLFVGRQNNKDINIATNILSMHLRICFYFQRKNVFTHITHIVHPFRKKLSFALTRASRSGAAECMELRPVVVYLSTTRQSNFAGGT
jgi:hypothetical protein